MKESEELPKLNVLNYDVKFIPINDYSKPQLAIAKLFGITPAKRYNMEARLKLPSNQKMALDTDVVDNFGKEWFVVSRNTQTNEYLLKSGMSIHECDGEYFLNTLQVLG